MEGQQQKLTLNASEAAAALGISRGSVYLAIEQGQLPVIKIGKRLLIPRKALEDLLASAGKVESPA